MVEQIKIVNKTLSKSLTIGNTIKSDLVYSLIDWGSADAEHSTYNYPGQVGNQIIATNIKPREVTVEGYVFYVLNESERINLKTMEEKNAYVYERILQKKSLLDSLINPLDYVEIVVDKYSLYGKPSMPVKYSSSESENNIYFCKFMFSVYCNEPLFQRQQTIKTILSGVEPRFHFPLVFKRDEGIIFGIRKNYQLITVLNEGDVEVGGIITFKANGIVYNPRLVNLYKNKYVRIVKVLNAGESVIINTNDGEQRGVTNYNGDNYFKYWDYRSSWMKFPVGTSYVGYMTDNGAESLLEVSIAIRPAKYSMEVL